MAQLENSSRGVCKLRTSLSQSTESLKKTKLQSDKYVEDIHQTWVDQNYNTFKSDYSAGTSVVTSLFKKMEEFNKKLLALEAKLKYYEDVKVKRISR